MAVCRVCLTRVWTDPEQKLGQAAWVQGLAPACLHVVWPSSENMEVLDSKAHPLYCRYLVTFSPLMDTQDDPQAIIIWDILTGQKKRGFHCESSAHWPIFK